MSPAVQARAEDPTDIHMFEDVIAEHLSSLENDGLLEESQSGASSVVVRGQGCSFLAF